MLTRGTKPTRQQAHCSLRKFVRHMILLNVFSNPTHRHHGRQGHALVLTLLILLVTAAVAFGVLSIGRHARVKEMTHFSAQAGAESGASWIARSLNTVAMNNNAMARLIVQAGMVQEIPTAIEMYHNDLKAVNDVLQEIDVKQLPRDWQPIDDDNPIALGFDQLKKTTANELRVTYNTQKYINKQLNQKVLADITHVQPVSQSKQAGTIWQAINSLDQINQAILENLEVQTQLSVLRGSILDTTARQTEASAIMLPTRQPLVQWKRGSFDDFAPIIKNDHEYRIANGYSEYMKNPAVDQLRELTAAEPVKIKKQRNRSGDCPISQLRALLKPKAKPSRSQNEEMPSDINDLQQIAVGDDAVLRTLGALVYRLENQRIVNHIDIFSKAHLNELWPQEPVTQMPVYESTWITDPQKIYEIMDKNPQSIREIAYVTLQSKSAFAPTDPKFRSKDSWAIISSDKQKILNVEYYKYRKELDPRTWEKLKMQQLHPRIWREIWPYQVYSDRTLHIKPLPATKKQKYPRQTAYRIDDYMLLGINVGKQIKLSSPYNFTSQSPKPAPILYVNDDKHPQTSDMIQRTVIAQNHVRSLPWATPVAPTQTASPMLAPYDILVNNADNKTLWFQGWIGRAVPAEQPNLADVQSTDQLQPLVSGKLFESVVTELKARRAQALEEETQVP
mgnify:CR=1 FL=1